MDIQSRFAKATLMKEEYSEFLPFLFDIISFQGFDLNWVQADIADYLATGPKKRAIFAQRGQAKSLITCMYAIWRIVQNPTSRILIVSANQTRANQNGKLVYDLIRNWEPLDYLRPDARNRDRDSSSSFDVHYMLKGIDKSPSVTTVGITGSITGARADVLIADDIELVENSATPAMREKLIQSAREFAAVCVTGEIIYLGTPQTKNSIYNGLPARGVDIRIWPGRYPSQSHIEAYGDRLAPSIARKLQENPKLGTGGGVDGTRGKPVDPTGRLGEAVLKEKEWEGPEFFELNYMLNTRLMDEMKQQLKLKDLIIAEFSDRVPEVIEWGPIEANRATMPPAFPVVDVALYRPAFISNDFISIERRTMTLDIAAKGGNEVAYAIGGVAGPYIHLLNWGGVKGGMTAENMTQLVKLAEEYKCEAIILERNFGGGVGTTLFQSHAASMGCKIGVLDKNSSGQKERRIIECLSPIMRRHRLVVHMSAIESDIETCRVHSSDKRAGFSGFYQMDNITTDRGCLVVDDRIDVLEQLCRELSAALHVDEHKAAETRKMQEILEFFENPTDNPNYGKKRKGRGPAYLRKRFGG